MKLNSMKFLIAFAALLASPLAVAANYTYDNLNRLISVVLDSGATQSYSYDAAGNLLGITTIGAKATQIITFGVAPLVVVGGTGTVTATATSGLLVGFTLTTPGICSFTGTTVRGIAPGNCSIAANQAGNVNFNPAPPVVQSFAIRNSQAITFGAAPIIAVGQNAVVSATSSSGLPLNFTSNSPGICSVNLNTVAALTAGSCIVAANQPGNAAFAPAPEVTQTINIGKGDQTLTFNPAPMLVVRGIATATVVASSGLGAVISSTTPGVCTVRVSAPALNARVVDGLSVGACTLVANQAGNANYNPALQTTLTIAVRKIVKADFNGDGVSDMLWRNQTTGQNTIWKSANGATPQGVALIAGWSVAGTGDFDGDGRADILWRDLVSGQNKIWKSATLATPQTVGTVPVVGWLAAGVGDFDGDGNADILWRNQNTGGNVSWKSANAATLQLVAAMPVSFTVAGVGDFNGDGKADILWRNGVNGQNKIWKSASSATPLAVTTMAAAYAVAGVGDFNGDGRADILWRNAATGQNVIWKSANAATFQAVATVPVAGWIVAGVGDYDGDGKADLVWRNQLTGANTIWKSANSLTVQPVRTLPVVWQLAK